MVAYTHKSTMNKSFTYKDPMTWIFYATPNALKSFTIQEILGKNAHKVKLECH